MIRSPANRAYLRGAAFCAASLWLLGSEGFEWLQTGNSTSVTALSLGLKLTPTGWIGLDRLLLNMAGWPVWAVTVPAAFFFMWWGDALTRMAREDRIRQG